MAHIVTIEFGLNGERGLASRLLIAVILFATSASAQDLRLECERFERGIVANHEAIRTWIGRAELRTVMNENEDAAGGRNTDQLKEIDFAYDLIGKRSRFNVISRNLLRDGSKPTLRSQMFHGDEFFRLGPVEVDGVREPTSLLIAPKDDDYLMWESWFPMYYFGEEKSTGILRAFAQQFDAWSAAPNKVEFRDGRLIILMSPPTKGEVQFFNRYTYDERQGFNLVDCHTVSPGEEWKEEIHYPRLAGVYVPDRWKLYQEIRKRKYTRAEEYQVKQQSVNKPIDDGHFSLIALGANRSDSINDTIRNVRTKIDELESHNLPSEWLLEPPTPRSYGWLKWLGAVALVIALGALGATTFRYFRRG